MTILQFSEAVILKSVIWRDISLRAIHVFHSPIFCVKVNQHCLINLVIAFDCGPINTLHIHNGRKNKQQKYPTNSDHLPQFVVVVVILVVVVVVVNSCIYFTIVSYFQRCFNSLTLMTKALINAAGILSL